MSQNNEALPAIIILELSDSERSLALHIPLMPTDSVVLDGKVAKQLQDCTLEELRRYADQLEEVFWSEFAHKSLRELLLEQGTIVIIDDQSNIGTGSPDDRMTYTVEVGPITSRHGENACTEESPSSDKTLASEDINHSEHARSPSDEPEDIIPDENSEAAVESFQEDSDAQEMEHPNLATAIVQDRNFRLMGKRRPQYHPTSAAVDILISEGAFRDTQAHALSSLDREVAGVLVGPQPEKQPDGRYIVYISDSIVAKHTRMEGASVTYTPESWRYVNDRIDELFDENSAVIVGWYHTHPGFGIFLSSMDRFIHRHFFTQIWHVAFVLDPLSNKSGFFCWNREQTKVSSYPFPWPEWANSSW